MKRKLPSAFLLISMILVLIVLPSCQKQATTATTTTAATTTATTAATTTAATTQATTTATTATTAATTSTETTATTGHPALTWSVKSTERSFMAGDGTEVLTINCTLLSIANPGNDPAGIAINQYFGQLAENTIGEAADLAPEAIDAYNTMGSDFYPWTEELTGEVVWQSEKYASTITNNYNYFGGAHPNTLLSSACFNLQTGQLMALRDFFTIPEDEVIDLLVGLIYEQTSTIMDETGSYLLYDCSEETIRNSFLPEHYYLTEEGLVLYFQPYDIAPYAAGLPQFLIPYDKLAAVFRNLE